MISCKDVTPGKTGRVFLLHEYEQGASWNSAQSALMVWVYDAGVKGKKIIIQLSGPNFMLTCREWMKTQCYI